MRKEFRVLIFALFFMVSGVIFHGIQADAAATYKIKINKQQNVVTVYKYKDGSYKPHKAFVCSTGSATPLGTYPLGEKIRWHVLDGPSYGQYCTRITGSILFHSVWYYKPTNDSQSYVQYNRLGTSASHGCVRLTVADAKWIYDNCPSGQTKVTIYNSSNPGPLGKPKAIKVSGYSGWDPTDPDPSNPYAKKNPVIQGVTSKNLEYGSKFNPKKGVTVKNSCGYNAKSLLTLKIRYKMDGKSTYKKVSKVDTKKPGVYKVTYQITDEINHKASVTAKYKVLTNVEVSEIVLSDKKKTLYLGTDADKKKFTLSVKKIKPAKATKKTVQFTSSDTSIATVTKKGVVTAKKAGTAIITAKAQDGSGTQATCTVTVRQYITKLTVTAPGKTLDVGNAMQLKTTVAPTDATNKKLTYISSDASIATVSDSGSVRALKPGTVTITVKANDGSGKTTKIKITTSYKYDSVVTTPPETVSVVSGSPWSVVEEKLPKEAVVKDRYGNEASAQVTWTSEDYDAENPGEYKAKGTITLPDGWTGKVPEWVADIIVNNSEAEDKNDAEDSNEAESNNKAEDSNQAEDNKEDK